MTGTLIPDIPAAPRYADLDTHVVAYVEIGTGAPVIFLHGGLMDHQSWGHQLPLAEDFRLILPDTRGHGRSRGADLPATYAGFADDTLALMDRLNLSEASLVGFSDGGCAALDLAMRCPGRVRNLVLIGTPYHLAGYNDGVVDGMRAVTPETLAASASAVLTESMARMQAHMSEADRAGYWERVIHGLWTREPDYTLEDCARVRARTLVLHGEAERFVSRRNSEELAGAIAGAQLVIVPDAGHSAAQENPSFVNAEIAAFLRAGG